METALKTNRIVKKASQFNYRKSSDDGFLKPYTPEEVRAMIAESERQLASGMFQDSELMMRELEEEFAADEQNIKIAQAV